MRDIVRTVQEMRKAKKFNPQDQIELTIDIDAEGKKIIEKFKDEISKVAGIKEISYESVDGGELIELDGFKARVVIG